MIQAANANWNLAAEDFSRASLDHTVTAMQTPIAVSASQPLALVEQHHNSEMVALATPTFGRRDPVQSTDLYSADTVVVALGLIGAWMMLVGSAMLSRRMAALKLQSSDLSAPQHQ